MIGRVNLPRSASHIIFDRKKYAAETKRAKNYNIDAVGSQQILKAFDRTEAVKRVKRNLVPVYIQSACTVCTACTRVCVRACPSRESGHEGEAGNVQCR